MEVFTKSTQETKDLGRKFSATLKGGDVIGLKGGLGSGKTTFVQGVAKALGIKSRVISPTFILMRKYEIKHKSIKQIYHIDLYRLEEELGVEIKNLGLDQIIDEKANVVFIEWADKIADFMPQTVRYITFEVINENVRKIIF